MTWSWWLMLPYWGAGAATVAAVLARDGDLTRVSLSDAIQLLLLAARELRGGFDRWSATESKETALK